MKIFQKRIEKIDWRSKVDLYNAHLFNATALTAKAEKLFKIQIKQSISVGMWTEELTEKLRLIKLISRHKSSNSHEVEISKINSLWVRSIGSQEPIKIAA